MDFVELKNDIEESIKQMSISDYYFDTELNRVKSKYCEVTRISDLNHNIFLLKLSLVVFGGGLGSTEKEEFLKKIETERHLLLKNLDQKHRRCVVDLDSATLNKNALPKFLEKLTLELSNEEKARKFTKDKRTEIQSIFSISAVKKEIADCENEFIGYSNKISDLNRQLKDCELEIAKTKGELKAIEHVQSWDPNEDYYGFYNRGKLSDCISFLHELLTGNDLIKFEKHLPLPKLKTSFKLAQYLVNTTKPNTYSKVSSWRAELLSMFNNPIPQLLGELTDESGENNLIVNGNVTCFVKNVKKTSEKDLSFLLALKIALGSSESISIAGNKQMLVLPGGLTASIGFMLKDDRYASLQDSNLSVYANCLYSPQFIKQTLYHQTGYTNSELQIEMPIGYMLIGEKYVVEIQFHPAPALFSGSNLIQMFQDSSSVNKITDEIDSANDAEEEERRRKEDDERYGGDRGWR